MDVRCEKCQTEYELDESRLKPGGVTVKCTNCGHMFKIRKRANTNVGVASSATPSAGTVTAVAPTPPAPDRARAPSKQPRADSVPAAPSETIDSPSGPVMGGTGERQWIVRLENGETKSCKELATLQQWIVAGVVSRESLISRSGKTWKRLGDISELSQYFVIADEARSSRSVKNTGKAKPAMAGTMLGLGTVPAGPPRRAPTAPPTPPPGAAHGADDDLERRSTGNFRVPPAAPPPRPSAPSPIAQTELAPSAPVRAAAAASIHERSTEPPQPKTQTPRITPPADAGRQTAAWAQQGVKASDSMAAMPQGPRGGKLSASPDEKAYGGRVRLQPSDDAAFKSGQVRAQDDDDEDLYPQRRGSRAGMWIALVSLLVIGAAAGAVYMLVFAKKDQVATVTGDAGIATADAMAVVVTPFDGGVEPPASPLEGARAELLAGVNSRMQSALDGLAGKDDPPSLAIRARLATAIAQSMQDRAMYVDKAEADKLRKSAKQLVVDTAPLAQRAFNGQQDSASANLAMADVLRLQAKATPAVKRYVDTARSKAAGDKELAASAALAEAQLALRDGKLPDAAKALTGVDAPDDMRVKITLAQIAHAQNKPADAKGFVEQVLATQPDHEVAVAMYKKLETSVSSVDPLPPEEGSAATPTNTNPTNTNTNTGGGGGGGDNYDALLAKANKLAESNCGKAMELFAKALEQKPSGVEALTGMGYCHLDAKQFSSAFSKFRAALGVSSRYEPALGGVAETYQRQGNKEAAIEAWRKYLEHYPGSPKAKKQLEILGADAGGGTPEPKKPPEETTPTPPEPTPTPAPTPAPEAGSAN